MTYAKDAVISALRLRYDHYSAESMFGVVRERASLADKPAYEAGELRALREVLAHMNDRLGNVVARLDDMLGAPAAPAAPAPAAKPEPAATAPEPEKHEKAEKPEKAHDKAPAHGHDKKKDKAKAGAIETTIVLAGVKAAEGDSVLVCGSLPALGAWEPDQARKMTREGDHWQTTITVPPDAEVAFKFLRRAADGTITWEGGENRQLAGKPRFEATWQ